MNDTPIRDWKAYFLQSVRPVNRIPPQIGRGLDGDPIYEPMTEEAYKACIRFYEDASEFLDGSRAVQPTIHNVIVAAVPHSSVLGANLNGDERPDEFGVKVLVKFEDLDRPREQNLRKARWFDPAYFPALLLLTYAGGSFRFNDKKSRADAAGNPTVNSARRLFLSFGRGTGQNLSVLRIVMDAPKGSQVHRKKSKTQRDFHYDYRRDALLLKSDDAVREGGYPSGYSKKGRTTAFEIAGDHLLSMHANAVHADPTLTRDGLIELLTRVFDLADRLHAKIRADAISQSEAAE